MPTKTTSSGNDKKKSLFGSFTDRRSRRSLVYNVREAESASSECSLIDPIEEKLDRLTDDIHSLQNTLRAVAHRVQDLEQVISEKQIAAQSTQELSNSSPHRKDETTVEAVAQDGSLRRRKVNKHDINPNPITDKKKMRAPQPPPALMPVEGEGVPIESERPTRSKKTKYDLDTVVKHELYRTVPKIIVDSCNLIEEHATIAHFDRVYSLSSDWDEVRLVLNSYIDETNYKKQIGNVKSMHTLANIVKAFFQELKYPVISISEIQAFLGTNRTRWDVASNHEKVDAMQKLMKSLPEVNRDTMKYFIWHLRRLSRDYPKQVSSQELAVSIAPCLFQMFRQKPKTSQENLRDDYLITYLQYMINHCDSIFKVNQRARFRKTLERCISCPGLFNL